MSQLQTQSETQDPADALVDVAKGREIAEVQGAILLAKKFPRDEKQALDKILIACQRPKLAETAIYSYARGGNDIQGPSIRLAEAIAQTWGNIQFGIRELEQRNGESTIEAFAWDMENNTRQTKTFQVPHTRYSRAKGNTPLKDPRDIYEMVANQGARRLRACILGVIPGDVQEMAVQECENTMKAKADVTPEGIKKMVETFEKMGVTKSMIEARIQRKVTSITPAQKVGLAKIFTSVKDGMSVITDWFEDPTNADKLNKQLGKRAENQESEAGDASPGPETQPHSTTGTSGLGSTVTDEAPPAEDKDKGGAGTTSGGDGHSASPLSIQEKERKHIMALFGEWGLKNTKADREKRITWLQKNIQRPPGEAVIESVNDLTQDEALMAIDILTNLKQ